MIMSKLKKVTGSLNKYLWLYRSKRKKRDSNLMVFGAWFGKKYDDNPRYLFEYVSDNFPEINAVWITESDSIYNKIIGEGRNCVKADTKEAKEIILSAKYIITATGRIDVGKDSEKYQGGAVYINLWHGIPLKKIMYDNTYSSRTRHGISKEIKIFLENKPFKDYYVVSTSPAITEIYQSAFRIDKAHILELGQPRNDIFYSDSENLYRKRFQNKKIILYMPTHRNEGKISMQTDKILDLKRIDCLCQENNAVFVIKKHFYHAHETVAETQYANIYDITNEQTESQQLLLAADVLITDYSSCYIDYLLLNRPIIFYAFDYERYLKQDREMYFPYDEVTPGPKCRNASELNEVLSNICRGDDAYSGERERVRNLFYSLTNQNIVSPQIFSRIRQL